MTRQLLTATAKWALQACRAATTPVPGQRGHRQQGRADAQAGGLPAQCDGVIEAEHIPGQVHRNVQHQAAPQGVAVEVVEPGEDQATEGDHRTDEQRAAPAAVRAGATGRARSSPAG
ncbi:hypothetical protein G6F56_013931 [Rhizopus delemar]|nr:hypothetical protein G6F56_013931 [Rhizopus delemar]